MLLLDVLSGVGGMPLLDVGGLFSPVADMTLFDVPNPKAEAPPGVAPAFNKMMGWLKWAFGFIAVGAFIAACIMGMLRALGHAQGEGVKKVLVVCCFAVVGSSAAAIITALLS